MAALAKYLGAAPHRIDAPAPILYTSGPVNTARPFFAVFCVVCFSGSCLVLVMSVFDLSSVRIFQRIPT